MAQPMRKEILFDPVVKMEKTSESLEIIDIIRECSWSDFGEIFLGFAVIYLFIVLAGIYQ